MTSGGARARSGPAPEPNSFRSMDKDWVDLPAQGYTGVVPDFPLPRAIQFETVFEDGKKVTVSDPASTAEVWDAEQELWADLWAKPQAAAWASLDLKLQVAAYVRAFLVSVQADAVSGMKTTVLRMETELGLSVAGMRQNGWKIANDGTKATSTPSKASASRRTSTGSWLAGVSVEGA